MGGAECKADQASRIACRSPSYTVYDKSADPAKRAEGGYRAIIDPTHRGFVAVLSTSLVMVP